MRKFGKRFRSTDQDRCELFAYHRICSVAFYNSIYVPKIEVYFLSLFSIEFYGTSFTSQFSLLGILDNTLYLFKYPPFVTAHKNKGKWKRACDSATIYCQFRCTRESNYPLKTGIEVSHYFSFSFCFFFFLRICFSFCRRCTHRKKCSVFKVDAFIYDNIIQSNNVQLLVVFLPSFPFINIDHAAREEINKMYIKSYGHVNYSQIRHTPSAGVCLIASQVNAKYNKIS